MDLVPRNVGREPRPEAMCDESLARAPTTFPRLSEARWLGGLTLMLLGVSLAGCQSLSVPLSQWTAAYDHGLFKSISKDEAKSSASEKVEQPRTLLARWLNPKGSNVSEDKGDDSDALPNSKSDSTLVLGSDGWRPMMKPKANPKAEKELDEAQQLFQQGKLADAEAVYKQIAKKRKGTQWGEKALYYVAECQYQQRKYVQANDSFERLFAEHSGTQYMDKLVSREYSLAQLWLAQSDPQAKPQDKLSWFARFTGEQPLLDTRGTALKALEHVRSHDPEGPLADDALLQIADTHMKSTDYESAAIYYDQLISTYDKSPFLQKAQLASIDARLKGYMGPDYDGAGLEKARDMVKQTMATFPDRQASYEGLFHTLDVINAQEAERTFHVGAFYKRVGKVTSAEYYFGKIPQRWPNSPWAVKAKTELAQLAKMPRKPSIPSKIMASPGSNDPYYSAGGGMGGMGGGMGGMGAMGGMGGMPGMN
ncbi:MAG: tetratricopeptide repeat protein [Isosphaeraceae bacterium]